MLIYYPKLLRGLKEAILKYFLREALTRATAQHPNPKGKEYQYNESKTFQSFCPLINKLYNVSGQIVDMVNGNEPHEFKGMTVVYCFFGGEKGAAFLALMPTKEKYCINDTLYNVILIPSAPVPVGGSMMLVPSTSIQPAEISIEDFMQVYISMGASRNTILPKVDPGKNDSSDYAI